MPTFELGRCVHIWNDSNTQLNVQSLAVEYRVYNYKIFLFAKNKYKGRLCVLNARKKSLAKLICAAAGRCIAVLRGCAKTTHSACRQRGKTQQAHESNTALKDNTQRKVHHDIQRNKNNQRYTRWLHTVKRRGNHSVITITATLRRKCSMPVVYRSKATK